MTMHATGSECWDLGANEGEYTGYYSVPSNYSTDTQNLLPTLSFCPCLPDFISNSGRGV